MDNSDILKNKILDLFNVCRIYNISFYCDNESLLPSSNFSIDNNIISFISINKDSIVFVVNNENKTIEYRYIKDDWKIIETTFS